MKKTKIIVPVVASYLMAAGCSHTDKVQTQTQAPQRSDKVMMVRGGVAALPRAVVYRTDRDYSELVAVTLDATGKRIVSFPDPADLRGTDPRPLPLRDGWLLDRRGVGPRTAFLDISVSDYAALEKAPSADSLLRHVKVRSPFTEMYALPLTADEARRDTAACNRIIAGGLKGCKDLLGRVRIVVE